MTEGVGQPPAAAAGVFGSGLDQAQQYVELLATEATTRGLIGPRELPRLWDRHLLNCAVLSDLIDLDSDVIDVGSGAGLPGIPLAIARPDLTVTLVEPLLRRSSWLVDVVDRLDLDNVTVRRARAEELHGRLLATHVTARAVAPLTRLVSWCLPLVRSGGFLLAMKGEAAQRELADAEGTIRRLGGTEWGVRRLGSSTLDDPTSVVQVRVGASAPAIGTSASSGARSQRAGRSAGSTKSATEKSTKTLNKNVGGER